MADLAESFPVPKTIVDDWFSNPLSIGQSSIPDKGTLSSQFSESAGLPILDTHLGQAGFNQNALFQKGAVQFDILEGGERQIRIAQVSPVHAAGSELNALQIGPAQISIIEIDQLKNRTNQKSSPQSGILQDNILKTSSVEIGSAQVDPSQVGIFNIGRCPTVAQFLLQPNTSKVTFPASIPFQQLFGFEPERFHNYNLQNTTVISKTQLSPPGFPS